MTETHAQAVERLKANEDHIIFADMNTEDQDLLTKIPRNKLEYLSTADDKLSWQQCVGDYKPLISCIYRIRPDYQPEPPKPEYVDLKIEERSGWLGVSKDDYGIIPYDFQNLHTLTSLPDFAGFYIPTEVPLCDKRIDPDYVAERIHKGHKVIARFRSNP
jgi:hypothetical protein